ncbi:MAG: hypothetical protein M1818_002113 [Claussenomyces sp. TS43310]|nr:MAG: hypothetical protein M1818_002113 [Claussenomyces sp. TS43310]
MTPCLPIGDTSPGEKEGFWSGFFPLQTGTEDVPKFRITVNDTAPIWFYCSAPGACIDDGMLGVVNPNSTQTLAVQQAYGKNSTIMLSPGEAIPPEGTTPSSTASPSTTSSRSSGLGGGAIAGIVVGGVAFLAVAGLAIYLFGRNHTLASILRYSQPRPSRSSNMPPLSYSAQDVPSPYSPGLETKEPMPSPEMSMPNNWQSAGYTSQTMSPENHSQAGDVYEGQGLMGSNILHKQFGQGHPQYTELDHQSQLQETHNPVRIQSSPGEAPWSPGGFGLSGRYTQVAPSEMGGEGISPGRPSPRFAGSAHGSYTAKTERRHDQDIGPHELDARPSVPETPQSPLDYDQASQHSSRRAFSFTEGSEAPPGVDKILQG